MFVFIPVERNLKICQILKTKKNKTTTTTTTKKQINNPSFPKRKTTTNNKKKMEVAQVWFFGLHFCKGYDLHIRSSTAHYWLK